MDVTTAPPTDLTSTPSDRLLTWSLAIAPLVFLVTDCTYAARGWDDGDAGGVHVIGAVLYGFVALRFVTWSTGRLQAAALVAAVLGTAGNVAYGFNTIHVALGAVDLVDASGPGSIIKPLGLFFPLSLLLSAAILDRRGRRVPAVLVAVAAVLWPVAHIANVAPLAIGVNVLLVCGLVPLAGRHSSWV
jgi:hypothetical protein